MDRQDFIKIRYALLSALSRARKGAVKKVLDEQDSEYGKGYDMGVAVGIDVAITVVKKVMEVM